MGDMGPMTMPIPPPMTMMPNAMTYPPYPYPTQPPPSNYCWRSTRAQILSHQHNHHSASPGKWRVTHWRRPQQRRRHSASVMYIHTSQITITCWRSHSWTIFSAEYIPRLLFLSERIYQSIHFPKNCCFCVSKPNKWDYFLIDLFNWIKRSAFARKFLIEGKISRQSLTRIKERILTNRRAIDQIGCKQQTVVKSWYILTPCDPIYDRNLQNTLYKHGRFEENRTIMSVVGRTDSPIICRCRWTVSSSLRPSSWLQ